MSVWADGLLRTSLQGGLAILLLILVFRLFPCIPNNVQVWMWRGIALKFLLGMVMPITIWTSTWHASGYLIHDPLPELIFLASAAGFLLALAALIKDWRAIKVMERKGVPVDLPVTDELCERLLLESAPVVLLKTDVDRPMLSGSLNPKIHLPADLSPEAQSMVVAHELAHIKRRDLAWEWLFVALEGIFFFHPLVWLLRREHRIAQEAACDEMAIRTARTSLAQYGRMLLDLAVANKRRGLALTANMAGTYMALHARILKLHRSSRRIGAAALTSLYLLTAVLIPTWRTEFRSREDYTSSPDALANPAAISGPAEGIGMSRVPKEGKP